LDPTRGGCFEIWYVAFPSKIISAIISTSWLRKYGPYMVCYGTVTPVTGTSQGLIEVLSWSLPGRTEEIIKNVCQDDQWPSQDSKWAPEYKLHHPT
jgi:hypothetical protein